MSDITQLLQAVQISGEPPSKDQLTSAHQKFGEALTADNDLRQQICQDLAELASNAALIEHNFMTIQPVVDELDSRGMLNNERFAPRWEGIYMQYSTILSDSKASTRELLTQIHEFVNVLLPIGESDDSDVVKQAIKMRHIEGYIENLEAFQGPAVLRGNQFLNLKEEVARFHQDLDYALQNGDNQIHNQRQPLKSRIESVKGQITELLEHQRDQPCGHDDGFWGFVTELVTHDNDNRRNDFNRQIQEKQTELSGLCQELNRVEGNENCIHRIKDLLKTHASWFVDASEKLSGMEGIWHLLGNEASLLRFGLDPMEEAEMDIQYDLGARSVRPVYEALESALGTYVSVSEVNSVRRNRETY